MQNSSVLKLLALMGLLFACIGPSTAIPYTPTKPLAPVNRDSVQVVLRKMAQQEPSLVGFIPETNRYFIHDPRREAISEAWLIALQDAFFSDTRNLCQFYGRLYLADWAALLSKAARESFWGASYLCNRTRNYFGIRRASKDWICNSFSHCKTFNIDELNAEGYVQFFSFEASLWMFIHTIYSPHYLERLPDGGGRVAAAIPYERKNKLHYWQPSKTDYFFAAQLPGPPYSASQLIYTWSGHPINNYCENCNRQTDWEWVQKIHIAEMRAEQRSPKPTTR